MTMHFPTVPIDASKLKALLQSQDRLRPLALVVDDEHVITDTLTAILNGSGFAALSAYNAADALEIARLMPPQILITDLAMPGMDGLELAVQVTRAVPDCEVILFSGNASMCDVGARMQVLNCDFTTLIKPVHPAVMIACVRERLARRGWSSTSPAVGFSRIPDEPVASLRALNDARSAFSKISVHSGLRSSAGLH